MARLKSRIPLDLGKDLVVRKAFKSGGRQFLPGSVFSWRDHLVTPRRVSQMYEAGYLVHEDIPVEEEPTKEPTEEPTDEDEIDEDLLADSIVVLNSIADREGAPRNRVKAEQRRLIMEHRRAQK